MNYLVLICSIMLLGCGYSLPEPEPPEKRYQPFPAGYGYMENTIELQQATDAGHKAVIRRHGWKLWAGIMQPDHQTGWPLWYSWPNTSAAFATTAAQVALPATDSKVQTTATTAVSITQKNKRHVVNVDTKGPFYPLPAAVIKAYPSAISQSSEGPVVKDGQHFQNNGDIMIATESLSAEAMASIRKQQLYLTSTLDKKHQKGVKMLGLPQQSIVTKHMYWPVKASGITALPVWNNNYPASFTDYAGYEV